MPAYLAGPGPVAMAHRGFSREGLENSLRAFGAAVDLGYRYLETDVHATSDGVLVAFHDDRLDRVTDQQGLVAELPWRVVSRARIGGCEPVPRLEDVLGTWPDVRVNIDVKAPAAVAPLVDVLRRTAATARVCVASFSDARRRAVVRRLPPGAAASPGKPTVAASVVAARAPLPMAGRAGVLRRVLAEVDVVQVPTTVAHRSYVQAVQAAGRSVHVWTVNEPAEMHRLLDLGVDGLITDRADLLRDVLQARGTWPHSPGPAGAGPPST